MSEVRDYVKDEKAWRSDMTKQSKQLFKTANKGVDDWMARAQRAEQRCEELQLQVGHAHGQTAAAAVYARTRAGRKGQD